MTKLECNALLLSIWDVAQMGYDGITVDEMEGWITELRAFEASNEFDMDYEVDESTSLSLVVCCDELQMMVDDFHASELSN